MVKQITPKRLENIALYYLERYESSAGKLRRVLKRRILRTQMQDVEVDPQAPEWVEQVIQKMQNLGYLDDRRYAENTFRRLTETGKSVRYITGKLKQDGIEDALIESLIEATELSSSEMDLEAARRLVDKKKLGHHRTEETRNQMYQKDLAVLGRAGFSYETARQALEADD